MYVNITITKLSEVKLRCDIIIHYDSGVWEFRSVHPINHWEDPLHMWIHSLLSEGMEGKHWAIAIAFGNRESSYVFFAKVDGCHWTIQTWSYYKFVNKEGLQLSSKENHTVMFHQLFWTFKPCVNAMDNVKPIIQVDDTFLYGKYRGTLLVATLQDGNRNMVPLAFVLVEGEIKQS